MTAFYVIYLFFNTPEGRKNYTQINMAKKLEVCKGTVNNWLSHGYKSKKIHPKTIANRLFLNDSNLILAFLNYVEKTFGWPVPDELKQLNGLTPKEFEIFLANFLYKDSKDKIQYIDILQARADNSVETAKATDDTKPIKETVFDFRRSRFFASCGKETTVFDVQKSAEGHHLSLNVNFEKNRLREVIPEHAGVYWLMHPAIRLSKENQICFSVRSEDKSISKIFLEIKPKGREWMHESFEVCVTSDYKEYKISCENFQYPETLGCLEEITIVIKTESFSNEELLEGKVDIANLCIN